ncbi:hypothetical protein SAMN05216175_101262 [Neptunomonas qingdaonensis]|uniref:Uncharacterized protein n=1 Tax=Neptunomonas qingdaonensis TaxID=1045558 RepID=A0A1I2LWY1_9GAMM|nr:hypothetical protein SAMN05216175_101262 [Neptunomonas qingdaonensis]
MEVLIDEVIVNAARVNLLWNQLSESQKHKPSDSCALILLTAIATLFNAVESLPIDQDGDYSATNGWKRL